MAERRAQVPGVDILFGAPSLATADGTQAPDAPEPPPIPAPGPNPVPALLAVLVQAVKASHVVELEAPDSAATTGLLASLSPGAVLTTIASEPAQGLREQLRMQLRDTGARERVRMVAADAAEVLPRLSDAGYDMVVAYGPAIRLPELREQVTRLLRPSGMLVLVAGRGDGKPLEHLVQELTDDPRYRAAALDVQDGVALATRVP